MNEWISILIVLLVHYLADFPLQCEFLKKYKSKSMYLLVVHCLIYSISVFLALYFLFGAGAFIFFVLFLSHVYIDKWKCMSLENEPDMPLDKQKKYLILDQSLHLMILLVAILGVI